jgi:hypothetical protein
MPTTIKWKAAENVHIVYCFLAMLVAEGIFQYWSIVKILL